MIGIDYAGSEFEVRHSLRATRIDPSGCDFRWARRDTLLRLNRVVVLGGKAAMKICALLLLGSALYAASANGQTESEIRDQIVGTWRLVSTEETMKNGATRPFPSFGPHAKGFLMYQRDGYMCAELMNPDLSKWADPTHATPQEKAAAADAAFAYCGRYEIDVKQSQIVHLPEVATNPGYVGSRQVRPYRLESGRLIFSDVEKNDPAVARWKIVWEKAR